MPPELEQPVTVITTEAAISALLYLFHRYAVHGPEGWYCQRISQRIFLHLEQLARREDRPELLRQTCDELSDAWLLIMDSQQSQLQARQS